MTDAAQHYTEQALYAYGLEAIELLKKMRKECGISSRTWAEAHALLTKIDNLTGKEA